TSAYPKQNRRQRPWRWPLKGRFPFFPSNLCPAPWDFAVWRKLLRDQQLTADRDLRVFRIYVRKAGVLSFARTSGDLCLQFPRPSVPLRLRHCCGSTGVTPSSIFDVTWVFSKSRFSALSV